MNSPCKDCGKTSVTNSQVVSRTHTNRSLDTAESALIAAWMIETSETKRKELKELALRLQKLKSPYKMPFYEKLWALRNASFEVGSEISCQYCKQHFFNDVTVSIDVALELESKHYGHAAKAMWHKEVHKAYWLLQAIWHKLILRKLDLLGERIKWSIFKSQQVKNVQSVQN